ncbi:hypothetical protein J3R82DRAFT_7543 [Butyriboletus roseoflavus]|nr:hypothetical protein J3R82DRAFT_7543 [Butyriboletus roseoflavus]
MNYNSIPKGIPIELNHYMNLLVYSVTSSTKEEIELTSTRRSPLGIVYWNFVRKGILIKPNLGSLANILWSCFSQLGRLPDLEEAIALRCSVLELYPQDHPCRAASLGNLAFCLHARFKHSPMHDIMFLADFQFVQEWIQKAEECKHSTTVLAYQTFLRLSGRHFAILPSLPQNLALLKELITSLAIDAFSACLRYGNPTNAIELLEQGRSVFWSQLICLRSPLDDVAAQGRNWHRSSPSNSQQDRAWRLGIHLQDVLADIRQLPGLSHFLHPRCFSDRQAAATAGPVIIVNASQYSCDALLLLSHQDPIHIPLSITKADVSELSLQLRSLIRLSKSSDVKRDIMAFLRELWDVIVFPIMNILQKFYSHRSRIWWCPTAEFSLLPLHAAGSFRRGQPMLSDLHIPTLTALIRARQERPSNPSIERHRFLNIGRAQAPGQNKLDSVNTELSTVSQRVGSVATLTCIRDQDATIAKVGEELSKNEFVHLACHGIPHLSGFALDRLLTIENIMRYDLPDAKFAYLSACHTTVGDEESPDEVIHLAAAMQFAGFRSVIGTMWAVDDAHTNEITSKFYDNMIGESSRLDHMQAALALHKTMRSI